jgi:nucleoid-associated protein YgaU
MARPSPSARRVIRAAATAAFAVTCLVAIVAAGFIELRPSRGNLATPAARFSSQDRRPHSQVLAQSSPAQFKTQPNEAAKPLPKPIWLAPLNVHDGSAGSASELIMRGPAEGPSTEPAAPEQPKPEASPASVERVELLPADKTSAPAPASAGATILVRAGDTLSKIATRLYGSFGADELGRLTSANPEIKNANLIYPGQSIRVIQTGK